MAIDSFSGDFDFLSNFYGEGLTVEHYYQANKTNNLDWKEKILASETPGRAKRLGSKAPLREDWDRVKVQIMFDLVRDKFKDPTLAIKLIDTYPHQLIEGNTWHDNFWGNCSCMKCRTKHKENMLGFILMQVRGEIMRR